MGSRRRRSWTRRQTKKFALGRRQGYVGEVVRLPEQWIARHYDVDHEEEVKYVPCPICVWVKSFARVEVTRESGEVVSRLSIV